MPVWQRARDASLSFCNRAYAAAVDADAPAADLIDGREIAAGLVDPDGRALDDRARRTGLQQSERHHLVAAGPRRFLEVWGVPLQAGRAYSREKMGQSVLYPVVPIQLKK